MDAWDERDIELGLRQKMAKIVASIISGINPEGVYPTANDFDLADEFRLRIEQHLSNGGY